LRSAVTMALQILYHFQDINIGGKSRFFIHPAFALPPLQGPSRNIAETFDAEKLEWCGCIAWSGKNGNFRPINGYISETIEDII